MKKNQVKPNTAKHCIGSLTKTFRIMKLSVLLFLTVAFQVIAGNSYSQTAKVSLSMRDATIGQVLDRIESQSEFYFLYNHQLIDVNRKVSINASDAQIKNILAELFDGTDVRTLVLGRQIILSPKKILRRDISKNLLAQQEITVTGTITDEQGKPLPGVNIVIKGTTTGTITDANGNYSLSVPPDATLVFSFVGYTTQEIAVAGKNKIDVTMVEEVVGLEEVIAVGYQSQRKVDLTGAVTAVDLKPMVDIPKSNPIQALQGRVPGLYIEQRGGPSGRTGSVLIRGLNTLGFNAPLYIIDGVPTIRSDVLLDMDPNTIASVQVLKDASAASVYGARASNGVIIITTKQGKGKLKVTFNSSITTQHRFNKVDVCNTVERGRALWQASINDGTDPNAHSALYHFDWSGTGENAVLNSVTPVDWIGGDESFGEKASDTFWQDVVYGTGLLTSNNLTLSKGTENSTALLSLGYVNNQGIMKYSYFKKLMIRLNTSQTMFKGKLTIGQNLDLSKSDENPEPRDLGGASMHHLALWEQPILPVYKVDGDWAGPIGSGFSDRNNPLHMLYIHKDNKNNDLMIFGNLYAELKPIKNMTLKSNFGLDYTDSYNWWIEQKYREGFIGRDINSLAVDQGHRINWIWSNTMNYDLKFMKNSVNLLLGIEAINDNFITLNGYKEQFAIQNMDYFYLDAGTGVTTNGGTSTGHKLLSYFGKVNYDLSNKYLASATLRYDGSSRFGTENKFGLFPAFTLGWRINNENFLKGIKAISNLKLRAGVGQVGNQEIGDIARFTLYRPNYGAMDPSGWWQTWRTIGTAYDLNGVGTGNLPSGYSKIQTGNSKLKWESTKELNIGIDFGFLKEKISGSFDYYTRKTQDILIQPPFAGVLGEGGNKWENGATKENKGFEFVLGYRGRTGDWTYNFIGSLYSFHDKITYLPESVVRAYPGNVEKTILGRSQTSVFGYITDGIFQNQAEVDAHAEQAGKGVGRIRYKDLNGDGKIDPLDQDWLGTTLPDFEYGLNGEIGYKNLTLSFFIQGVAGKSVYDGFKWDLTTTFYNGMNFGREVFNAWSPQNTSSDIPALSLVNANHEDRSSDYFFVNGSYFKLRNLQLTYTLPKGFIKGIEQLRIYILGENLLLIKDTKGKNRFFGPDPEISNQAYPLTTNFTFGINLSL